MMAKKIELSNGMQPDTITGATEALSSYLKIHHPGLKVNTEILQQAEAMKEQNSVHTGTKSIRQLLSDAILKEATEPEEIKALKEYQTRIKQLDADTAYLNDC